MFQSRVASRSSHSRFYTMASKPSNRILPDIVAAFWGFHWSLGRRCLPLLQINGPAPKSHHWSEEADPRRSRNLAAGNHARRFREVLQKMQTEKFEKTRRHTVFADASLPLSLLSSKGTFSQPFKEKCISDVTRICTIIIFHLSKLWTFKFSILRDVLFLVRLQGKLDIDHS